MNLSLDNKEGDSSSTTRMNSIYKEIPNDLFRSKTNNSTEPKLEGRKLNELRYFNLYRYYLSQNPELFSSNNNDSIVPKLNVQYETPNDIAEQTLFQQLYRPDLADKRQQTENDEQLSSKLIQLSMHHRTKSRGHWRRSNTETVDSNGSNKCCLTCGCNNQSDSSQWSFSEPDLNQMNRYDETDRSQQQQQQQQQFVLQNPNMLTTTYNDEEQYSHLSRVITPPNDFLNNSANTNDVDVVHNRPFVHQTNKMVSYSNKVTQTDLNLSKLDETQQQQQQQQQQRYNNRKIENHSSSIDSGDCLLPNEMDHVYYAIQDQLRYKRGSLFQTKKTKMNPNEQTKLVPINMGEKRTQSANASIDLRLKSSPLTPLDGLSIVGKSGETFPWTSLELAPKSKLQQHEQQQQQQGEEHRLATSKNGLPCGCERCRESRA
ncbi:hypothetical protein RDWZM_007395 [Blomia tropicalis]|uniref:Uncharacterized protein n=1 Tax=Blomia tropicalis TaxID=40697 RepID=A0A9Q0M043_BLOTA|nr:hypothetical protein RDWZM_007395 [Blomia tropicalis]